MMGYVLLALAACFLFAQFVTTAMCLARLQSGNQRPNYIGHPRLTLLRPICGRDAFDEETLGSSFYQDYPCYEVIFCVEDADDPCVEVVRRLIAAHPAVPARLLIGKSAITGNPKLNNLAKGWRAVTTDWVCMSDSNLLLPQGYLQSVVATWGGQTGLVSSPPVGVRPEGLAASIECAFLNGNQARLQLVSDSAGHGFAQGKTLFWNRKLLNRHGGLAALGQHLAEDVAATKLIRSEGLRVSLTQHPFAQPIGRRSFAQVWSRQLRWSRVRRDGFPVLFAAEIANGVMMPLLVLAAASLLLSLSSAVVLSYLGLWYSAEILLIWWAGWPMGWRDLVALPLRDLLMPALWAATFLNRGIEWRGNAMAPPQREVTQEMMQKLSR
jgi:ceramide glucosyltransferase